MKKMLKKIISVALVGATLGSTLIGCGDSNYKNGELNIFNWTEYIPNSVIKEFEKEYKIKVNYSTYSSNEECLAKIQSSAKGTYDIVVPSDYMITIMKEKGLLEKMDLTKLSNFKNLDTAFTNREFDPNNEYSVPFSSGAVVVAVNTDKVKDEITSYKDLINSSYKQSIVSLDDERAVIGMGLKALGYSLNETDPTKLAEAKEWLTKFVPNVKLFDSDTPKAALISGEATLGYMWNAEAALAAKENKNIKIVYPKEGMYIFIDSFAIPKGAKNVTNAQKFINFILRPEVNKKIVEAYPYKSVNAAAQDILPESYKNNPASNIPSSEMAKGEFIKDVGNSTATFDKIWSEIKK